MKLLALVAIASILSYVTCVIVGLAVLGPHSTSPLWWVTWLWVSSTASLLTGWGWFDRTIMKHLNKDER